MSISRTLWLVGALILGTATFVSQPATSKAAESHYYKGKTLRIIVGAGVGGGYDAYARMLAPHFAKRLGAQVLVQNIPGADGMVALNRLSAVPGDGLSLFLANGLAASLMQMLDVPGVKYDLTRFKFLGIVHYSRWQILVAPNSPYNNLSDLMKSGKTIMWGGTGKIGIVDASAMACHALHLKCRMVTGYPGSRNAALAVAQGEVDALSMSETSSYDYVTAMNLKPIANTNRKRSTLFPDLPTVFEQLPNLTKEQQWWFDYHTAVESLGRLLLAPPGTPEHLVEELRATTDAILRDPEVVEEGKKKKRFIVYTPASEAKKAVLSVLASVTPEQKAQIKKVVLETYY